MKRCIYIAALMAAVATAGQSELASPSAPVLTLVGLMRTDELLANAAKDGVRRAHADRKISDAARECGEQIDRTRFTALVARIFSERMSPEEIDKSIEFYRSDAGKKYTRYIFERAKGKPMGQFTTGEEMRVNQFGKTPYGRKLLTSSILEGADDIRTATAAAINDAIANCGTAQAPAR